MSYSSSLRRLLWLVGAVFGAVLAIPSVAVAQVQVGQVFNSQGPAPDFGNVLQIHSTDAGNSNGTAVGAIQAIVPDPALGANTWFAASANGGIWMTNNLGATWTALTDKQVSLSIASLTLDPTDTSGKTLIAGTGITSNGQYNFFNTGFDGSGGLRHGLLYSTDAGATWSNLGGTTLANQTVIGVAARGKIMLAATFEAQVPATTTASGSGNAYGLYRSTDGGATFNLVGAGVGLSVAGPVSSLVGDPSNPNKFYAAVSSTTATDKTSIFVSNDAGGTWTQVFNKINANGLIGTTAQTSLTVATGPNGSIAVGVIDDSTNKLLGVFLSQNNGTTWHQLIAAPQVNPGKQAPVNFAITIDPNNANIVYITGDAYQSSATSVFTVKAFRITYDPNTTNSTSASLTFEGTPPNFQDANTAHADSRALAFDSSGRLIMTSDGGIFARTNPQGSGTWQNLNGNLSGFEAYNVAFDANSKRLVVAAQDNGVSFQSGVNNPKFNAIIGGDGINAVLNDRTLNRQTAIYTSYQQIGGFSRLVVDANGNVRSPPGDPSGIPITCNGIDCATTVAGSYFASPVVLNRVDPTRIAIGGRNAYVTQDPLTNVTTATTLDLLLTNVGSTGLNPAGNSQQVTAMAYGANDNPNALLVGAGDRLSEGNLGTLSFSATAGAGTLAQLPAYAGITPTSVVFDARTAARFYVADSVNLWGTTNTGLTITNVGLGNLPASFIRPTSVEFISNNGVNALLVGGLNNVANAQSPIVVADSDTLGTLTNWRFFGSGLPNALIYQMVYNPTVDVLAVSSIGRGAWTLYDVTSLFPQATVLQFGLANNDSMPDASFLTNGTVGNRQLIKYGTGTLTIGGDATYTGGTTIKGGALVLGTGGTSGSIVGNVTFCGNAADPSCDATNNKALMFNRSDMYTFGGSITGPGQLFQIGSGKTVLTGASTFSGPTFVNNGTLSVNGSITSSVFVNNGGTLGGNGSVGATSILAGGTLSPGNSVGTLTVNGNLAFNPGSLYFVEVFGNTADRTNATGTATLAGTVAAAFTGGNLTNRYTILSAGGGLTGTFGSVVPINAPAFITASLSYTSTDVLLNLNSGIVQTPGLTRNQNAVAAALDSSFNNGGGTLPGLLGLSASQLPAAMDALSGEGLSGTQETAFAAANMFNALMMDQGAFWRNGDLLDFNGVSHGDPLQFAPSKRSKAADHPAFKAIAKAPPIYQPRWRTWVTGFDGTWKLNGETGIGSAPLSHNTGGAAAGLDYQFAPDVLAGFAVGGSSSNFSVPARVTSGHLDGAHFGGYGVKTWGSLYAAGALSFNTFRDSTSRTIAGVGPAEVATASFGSNLLSGRLEVGSKYTFSWLSVTPFAAVQVSRLWQNGFTETNIAPAGAGVLGLTEGSVAVSSVPTFLGVQFDSRYYLPGGTVLSPYTRVSWMHEFNPTRQVTNSFIALPGTLFTVDGPHAAADAAKVEVGGKLAVTRSVKAFASFDGEFSNRSQGYAGKGGVIVAW